MISEAELIQIERRTRFVRSAFHTDHKDYVEFAGPYSPQSNRAVEAVLMADDVERLVEIVRELQRDAG